MKILLIFLFVISMYIPTIHIEKKENNCIDVYVKGEVYNESSFCVPPYSTIEYILAKVQLTNEADCTAINPLTILTQGDVIQIPKVTKIQKISINFSTLEDLMTIKGIGESTAKKIISYREEFGLFQTIEDVMNVSGIKQAKFDQIKDYICL